MTVQLNLTEAETLVVMCALSGATIKDLVERTNLTFAVVMNARGSIHSRIAEQLLASEHSA